MANSHIEDPNSSSDHESEKSTTIADVHASGSYLGSHTPDGLEKTTGDVEKTAWTNDVEQGNADGDGEEPNLVPVVSNPPPPAVPVPRRQRRGLLAQVTIIAEVTEPKHYSRSIKWTITFLVALAAAAAPLGSAIFFRMSSLMIINKMHTI